MAASAGKAAAESANAIARSELVLGIKAFFARSKYRIAKGNNPNSSNSGFGRAVLSPSHAIIGRFQRLKSLKHRNLCSYIDIMKGKHDRLFVVSEHYTESVKKLIDEQKKLGHSGLDENTIRHIMFQILSALSFLNEHNIRHRCLSWNNVLLDPEGNVRLSDYGLYEMTSAGSLVAFPVGELRYMAPEDIADAVSVVEQFSTPKSDVWALGILALEMVTGSSPFQATSNSGDARGIYNLMLQILQFCGLDISVSILEQKMDDLNQSDMELLRQRESGIAGYANNGAAQQGASPASKTSEINQIDPTISSKMLYEERELGHAQLAKRHSQRLSEWLKHPAFASISEDMKEIIELCLTVDPEKRVSPEQLMSHPFFADLLHEVSQHQLWVPKPFARSLLLDRDVNDKWRKLFIEDYLRLNAEKTAKQNKLAADLASPGPKSSAPRVAESFYSATVPNNSSMGLAELFHFWKVSAQAGIDVELAPQLSIAPPILRLPILMRSQTIAESDIRLVLQQHGQKDESRKYDSSFVTVPIAQLRHTIAKNGRTVGQLGKAVDESEWSIEEKERDMAYQRRRVRLFRDLLAEYPASRSRILKEAKVDVPPSLRAQIWAAVLGVPSQPECKTIYDAIDKESDGPADRQIELDIPRCHQYHELLSSPLGHRKFKNVLKAWVANNPGLSYWQGIDSLLAPFLSLNFDDEPTAFCCLQTTIEKYSKNLFTKDNSVFFQEHLQTFKQLLLYHDPELGLHLHHIGFQPDLYAIPWFLTLFTHDFTIDQIYRLWDRVLVGDSRMPFFLSFSIMKQLREILLPLDFNACILLFSSLPSIDIGSFLQDADEAAQNTPPSVTMPNYTHDSSNESSTRWWDRRVTLEELQQEIFPRLSVTDLVSSKFIFSIVDVRETPSFASLHFPNSIHINPDDVDLDMLADKVRGNHIVVVGDQAPTAAHFANRLVEHGLPKVSVLNGGIDALSEDAGPLLQRSDAQPLL